MPLSSRRVTDATALKALAHPVRLALLSALISDGPMTATQLATHVQESPSNCSWHLRRLAAHGFVRETRGSGGRARPWRAVAEGLAWGEPDPGPDQEGRLASDAVTDLLLEREVQRFRAARAGRNQEHEDWRASGGLVHAEVWLTAEEAVALRDDLARLAARYADRGERADGGPSRPDRARLVTVVGWLAPSRPENAPPSPSA